MYKPQILIFFNLVFLIFTIPCEDYTNNCDKCHPSGDYCVKCSSEAYEVKENGECKPKEKCTIGENYCNECNSKGNLCLVCEIGYYPDENGGCASTENCLISLDGECLTCKEDFTLITNSKYCKYNYADDLKNCKSINNENGKCDYCENNYYLTQGDFKCIETENCFISKFGLCEKCKVHYYLDKTDEKCKNATNEFTNCKISLDGKTCEECADEYHFSEDGKCTFFNFCSKTDENFECVECSNNYYFTEIENACTQEELCLVGDSDYGLCKKCIENYYLDLKDSKCKSNKENNEFLNCQISYDVCIYCEIKYYLDENSKCTNTMNCAISENGICKKCKNNFYLDLENYCTSIEHCIYSNKNFYTCAECENNYYYDTVEKKCKEDNELINNCKNTNYLGTACENCKNGFYFSYLDNLCHNNTEEGPFYKCVKTEDDGLSCSLCEYGYYLSSEDKKCVKMYGCAISENENKCIKCQNTYCLNLKNYTCEDNFYDPKDINKLFFYNCNKTNEEGTECAECINDEYIIINGLCNNINDCEQFENDKCVKCKNVGYWGVLYPLCLNKDFGCVTGNVVNCSICDNSINFKECNECQEGYEFDEENNCIEIDKNDTIDNNETLY